MSANRESFERTEKPSVLPQFDKNCEDYHKQHILRKFRKAA